MKWDTFIHSVADLPLFDLTTVVQLFGEPKPQVGVQLHRWIKMGRVLSLRRGLYTLDDIYRRTRLSPLLVANALYQPSYLSCLWALSFYGLIPDAVPTYQNVTTRVTRHFSNTFGWFRYSSLKQDSFWGFATREIDGVAVSVAHPEKALLDLWHLTSGEWTADRLSEMRFQQLNLIDRSKLDRYADRWNSPRIRRAASRFEVAIEAETIVEAGV